MDLAELNCLWGDYEGPIVRCHHPMIESGFCDYTEDRGIPKDCPFFEYEIPYHEVEIRQHLEMMED